MNSRSNTRRHSSPADVIEEYIRPARYVENGHLVVKPALSDVENMDVAEIGTLEAFNSDGLRSLPTTIAVPNMIEKTLRYPGHVRHILALRDSGFFGAEEIDVGAKKVRPLDATSAVLFKHWRLHEEDDEVTVMRIVVEGLEGGRPKGLQYDLFDRRDRATGFSSMARTTGFPATAAARLVLSGKFVREGICPPEFTGSHAAAFQSERLGEDFQDGVIYFSDQTHYCVTKAARLAGFPRASLHELPTDERFRLVPEALERAIREDRSHGRRPFLQGG